MLATSLLPLSQMTAVQMRSVYNLLAQERGRPLAARTGDRFLLGKGIAILRTIPKKSLVVKVEQKTDRRRNRAAPLRDAVIKELERIAYYENDKNVVMSQDQFEGGNFEGDWYSVGFPYHDVAKAVAVAIGRRFTQTLVGKVRSIAHMVREKADGFIADLPERRPRSTKENKR